MATYLFVMVELESFKDLKLLEQELKQVANNVIKSEEFEGWRAAISVGTNDSPLTSVSSNYS